MRGLIILFLLIALSITALAQWEVYRKGISDWVHLKQVIMITEDDGFAVAGETIFATSDGGMIWEEVHTTSYSSAPTIVPPAPSENIAYVLHCGKLYYSKDMGWNWILSNSLSGFDVQRMQVVNDTTLLLSVNGAGNWLQYSFDRGSILQNIQTGSIAPNSPFHFFTSEEGFIADRSGDFFYTTDSGMSWEERDSIPLDTVSFIDFYDEQTGFAFGPTAGSAFKTTDGGYSWHQVTVSGGESAVVSDIHFVSADNIYLRGEQYILYSSDGGENWTELASSLIPSFEALSIVGQGAYISGISLGSGYAGHYETFYTEDAGQSWQLFTLPITDHTNVSFVNDTTVYISGGESMAFNGYMVKTNDGFKSFNAIRAAETNGSGIADMEMVNDSTGYIAWTSEYPGQHKTTDGGVTWQEIDLSSSTGIEPVYKIKVTGENHVFFNVGLYHNMLSTDGGSTWTEMSNGWNANGTDFFFLDTLNFYYSGWFQDNLGVVDHSSDGGQTWERWIVADTVMRCVYFRDTNNGWAGGMAGTIVYTTDGGTTWHNSSGTDQEETIYKITFVNETTGFALGYESLFKTTDGGQTWGIQDTPEDESFQDIVFINENTGYVFGSSGLILKTVNGGDPVMDTEDEAVTVTDFSLSQNYPNPFNPSTTINFGLPEPGNVKITIYNQLGQVVETLINKEFDAGYHEIEWNAARYSTGVYFYTINAGNFKSVKKMLLLK